MIEILRMLNSMSLDTPRKSGNYYFRPLDKYDHLPSFTNHELDHPLADREWIWAAFSLEDDKIIALLATAPMLGVVTLLRIYAISSVNRAVLVGLLRKTLADSLARGYTRYATYLDLNREVERKLSSVVLKAGGISRGALSLFDGPTDIGAL